MRVLVPSEELAQALRAGCDAANLEILVWDIDGDAAPPAAEVLVTQRPADEARFPRATAVPGLRHLHLLSLGYEWTVPHLPPGVRLTNSRGAVEDATAELALALVLASLRALPRSLEQQRAGRWDGAFWTGSLHGARALVLGHGGVGSAVVRRLEPFRPASITVVASRARVTADGTTVHGPEDLRELLPASDVVVVTLPHTPATEGTVDAGFLRLMPDGALLVNVGRGAVVDTEALVRELEAGRLRAALDVTAPEPLPPGHPLWSAPNCLITPHVGGNTHEFRRLVTELTVDQVRRLAAGLEPLNVIEV